MEIIETGDLQRLYYAKTEVTRVTGIFTKIYGVGALLVHILVNTRFIYLSLL